MKTCEEPAITAKDVAEQEAAVAAETACATETEISTIQGREGQLIAEKAFSAQV